MIEHASILDVVSLASQRDSIFLVPSLEHAMVFWRVVRTAFAERHGLPNVHITRTHVVMRDTHTSLALGIPYGREVTLPTDQPSVRHGKALITPYTRYEVRGWLWGE